MKNLTGFFRHHLSNMIDHFNLPVSNLARSSNFYEAALASLEMQLLVRDAEAIGFGKNTWEFGIVQESKVLIQMHVAFVANSREEVRNFYAAALEAGGLDNGSPGLRIEYAPSYYSAYVLDPDGHNIEAVCRCDNSDHLQHNESALSVFTNAYQCYRKCGFGSCFLHSGQPTLPW